MPPKKRAKGGKIIKKINEKINPDELKKPNIILQLKCSSKDLQKKDNSSVSESNQTNIKSYTVTSHKQNSINYEQYNNISYVEPITTNSIPCGDNDDTDIKEIWEKLRILKLKLS